MLQGEEKGEQVTLSARGNRACFPFFSPVEETFGAREARYCR
jgi:hypothetical protein